MSDATISGIVTITPNGGGWYTLTTPTAPEGERVQGKEAADTRAAAINAEATPPDGTMEPQGSIEQAAAVISSVVEPAPPPAPPADFAAFMKQFQAMQSRLAELEKAQPVTTVTTAGDAEPQPGVVPGFVPREYSGKMDPKAKEALAKLGFGVTTIILEENDSIPPTGLFVGHNGRAYMIKPGEEVDVPDFIISVLDDAVMSTPIVSEADKKVLGFRDRSKYPYRRVNAKG